MLFNWWRRWANRNLGPSPRGRRAAGRRRPLACALACEPLEDRTLLSPTLITGFDGINASQSANVNGGSEVSPPDTDGAAGPNAFLQHINSALALYDKTTGNLLPGTTIISDQSFYGSIFQSGDTFSDTEVLFDPFIGRYATGVLEFTSETSGNMFYDFAISKTSTPTSLSASDWSFFQYNVNDGVGASFDFADYPKIGFNADGFVVSFNMFPANVGYDHVSVLAIRNDGTSPGIKVVPGGTQNFTLAPATMHTSAPGDPMWFVEGALGSGADAIGDGGTSITVVRMDNTFSAAPTFTNTVINVNSYDDVPVAKQPGGNLDGVDILGTRFYFSALQTTPDGVTHLVSAHDVGSNGGVRVRWYDISVSGSTPTLVQEGEVDNGSADTYLGDADISANGVIAMSFDESSSTEFMSMYVTVHTPQDPLGAVETPVQAKAGKANLDAIGRAGDYSFTSIDPVDGSFWATNEYATTAPTGDNWATWIENFNATETLITGHKFFDLNATGTEDPGDPHLPGWTIFVDLNGTGVFQSGDPFAVTDANGNYSLLVFGSGTFQVLEEVQPGWLQTTANPPPIVIPVGSGFTEVDNVNFGNITLSRDFVIRAYRDVLLRPGDRPGVDFWTSFIDAGGSRQDFVNAMLASPEYQFKYVNSLYETYLGRPVDPVGLSYSQQLLNSISLFVGDINRSLLVRSYLLSSGEYFADKGGSNNGFLAGLYLDAMGRSIDATGLAVFGQQLASGVPRRIVALEVLDSVEAESNLINGYYVRFLHRQADAAGLGMFIDAFQHGATENDIIASLVSSNEYFISPTD
jgi:hypothetical protein